jgi:hypothetical protein
MRQSAAFDSSTWDRKGWLQLYKRSLRKKITDLNDYGEILLGKTSIPSLDDQLCSGSMLLSRWKYRF